MQLLLRPTTWVSLALFALVSGTLFWLEFLGPGGAELSMRAWFERAPLLLAVFAPAWAMDTLTAERRHGTLAVWRTRGVAPHALVGGTFAALLGVWTLLWMALAAAPWSLSRLGPLDVGATVAGFVGLWLLGASFLAVGHATASATRDPVVALLAGVTLCGLLVGAGDVAGAMGADALAAQSIPARFRSFARGVLDVRDVAWFVALTVVALGVATRQVQRGGQA